MEAPYSTVLDPDPNVRGAILTRSRRNVGKQVQISPTSTSMVDHQTISHWSHVGFDVEAYFRIEARRKKENKVTLFKT